MSQNAKPIIAWDNKVVGATLTASTEATGYPVENVGDWKTYTHWKGTGLLEQYIKLDAGVGNTFAVSCLAIAAHDLKTQNVQGLALKYSDNDAAWFDCFTPFDPAADTAIWKSFTAQDHRYFMMVIPAGYTAAPYIGILFVGAHMQFPSWPSAAFDPDEQEIEFEQKYSRSGNLLGVDEYYRQREVKVQFNKLTFTWFDTYWMPFWNGHAPKPFVWVWDETNHADEAYLMSLKKGQFRAPMGPNSRSLTLEMMGVV